MSEALRDNDPTPFPRSADFLGHPKPLWLLFATEFWERFAYYGMRALLAVYVASTFFALLPDGEAKAQASLTYGAYTALIYATGIFGGFIADRYLGYRPSILLGGTIMALGLFLLLIPDLNWFLVGLAVIVVGNGLFKPNISTMVGKLYAQGDARRDSGFTIFYMGINAGATLAPLICGTLVGRYFGYQWGFFTAGIGMIFGLLLFQWLVGWMAGVGRAPLPERNALRVLKVTAGCLLLVPVVYLMLSQARIVGWLLMGLMLVLTVYFVGSGMRSGDKVQLHRYIAMLLLFLAKILFWGMFEQAGSSLNFFAKDHVDAPFDFTLFQSANPLFIILLAPVFAWLWPRLEKRRLNPSIPRKFGLGIIFNGLAFLLLMFALSSLVDPQSLKIPFWTLFMVYVIQSIGELCLSPIGLSMVTKLAPVRLVGFGMGGWFLSTAIGNNLSGIFASHVSGEGGMSVESALSGYTFGFWVLVGSGVFLFLIAPLIQKLMHGVK